MASLIPCSCRTVIVSIALLVLLTVVEIVLFKSLEDRWLRRAIRVHLGVFIELAMFLSAWYIWKRVAHLFSSKNLLTFGGLFRVVLFFVLCLSHIAFILAGAILIHTDPSLFAIICSVSVGLVIFLTSSLIIVDVTSYIVRRIFCRIFSGKMQPVNKFKITKGDRLNEKSSPRDSSDSRNKLELKIRTLVALVFALILTISGAVGISRLAIERVHVPVKGLHHRLNGTTIVQISDIHLGPFIGKTRLQRILGLVNQLEGDIVVITGDLVDASVADLNQVVKPLADIKSKHGVYYITGNHEYYTGDVDNWIAKVAKLNIKPLVNERLCLHSTNKSCKGGLYIAGLEDIESRHLRYGSHSMDIHAALTGRTKGVPTIVLAHQPRAAKEAIMWDDVRLVLSGHTHGGQFLPWMLFIYLVNPFYVGLYQPMPDVYVYVSPGTNYFMIPFRHYRPEITHITLISA